MATATLAPHQVDHTRALHRHPRITLAVNTAAALRVTPTIHPLLGSHTVKDMEVTAHNNTRHSRSRDTAMALRLASVDSPVMGDQLLATAKDHHRQALVVTVNKV